MQSFRIVYKEPEPAAGPQSFRYVRSPETQELLDRIAALRYIARLKRRDVEGSRRHDL